MSGYYFHSVSPVTLTKGAQYVVDAYVGSNDWSYGTIAPNQAADVTYSYHAYFYVGYLVFPDQTAGAAGGPGGTYYGPNFEYTNTSAIPEPSVWALMLLGFAGLGFAGYRATRKGLAFAT